MEKAFMTVNHATHFSIRYALICFLSILIYIFLQIVILPHNLKIVDYTIGVPGSIHDASAFQRNWIARHPEQFLNNGEWIWADSAYPAQTWCVTPFK